MRYRMYADNAVDIIIHLRDIKVVWVSPSVEPALGDRRSDGSMWISAATSIPTISARSQLP